MTDQPQPPSASPEPEVRPGRGVDESAPRAVADERRDGREPSRLGPLLREAREQAGLGLSDLAEVTHVRRVYLVALEEGRYAELPEDVYARNFVRLYANAVGLDANGLLEQYARERRQAIGHSTLEQRLDRDRRSAREVQSSLIVTRPERRAAVLPAWLSGPWLPTLALVVVVVGLAVWGFNALLAGGTLRAAEPSPSATGAQATTAPAAGAGLAAPAAGAGEVEPAAPTQVRVSIVTDPPGAAISIDGFPVPGVTPLLDVPVTAREGRLVRAELDGFQAGEVRADLRQDADVSLTLVPLSEVEGVAAAAPVAGAPVAVAGDAGGALVITITDTTWLEVYRSTARNEGERLVYTTAQSGQSYQFTPPVFVYTGNAAGVRLTHAGQDLGPMGSPGAVLGRSFPE